MLIFNDGKWTYSYFTPSPPQTMLLWINDNVIQIVTPPATALTANENCPVRELDCDKICAAQFVNCTITIVLELYDRLINYVRL